MIKIVISTDGLLEIPESVIKRYCELEGVEWFTKCFIYTKYVQVIKYYNSETKREINGCSIDRDNPSFLKVVKEYIKECIKTNECYYMKIVEIPDGVNWRIVDNENWYEYVEEVHRIWE